MAPNSKEEQSLQSQKELHFMKVMFKYPSCCIMHSGVVKEIDVFNVWCLECLSNRTKSCSYCSQWQNSHCLQWNYSEHKHFKNNSKYHYVGPNFYTFTQHW